jgi:hypothetical protein
VFQRQVHSNSCRLQPSAQAGSSLADLSTLKMEAIRSSETSVHTRSTWRHIPEDGILHNDTCLLPSLLRIFGEGHEFRFELSIYRGR